MKRLILLSCILLLLLPLSTKSQQFKTAKDSMLARYDTASLILVGSEHIRDGQSYRNGFNLRRLLKAVKGCEPAEQELRLFRKKMAVGLVLYSAGFAVVMTGLIVTSPAVLLVGSGLAVASMVPMINASKHPPKAIWLYNRHVIAGS